MISVEEWDGVACNQVICGDMLAVCKKMKVKADVTFTSPPYGVRQIPSKGGDAKHRVPTCNLKYDAVKDSFSRTDYSAWLSATLARSTLTFWNVPPRHSLKVGDYGLSSAFGHIVWVKSNGSIPFAYSGIIYAHELIYLLGDPTQIIHNLRSVWKLPTQRLSSHPAPFHPSLPHTALTHTTQKGDLVFDPFGGSGTVAAVAKMLGRRWITCDVSRAYCEWMDRRIEETKEL